MALNMAQKSEASTLHPLAQECSPCLKHAVTEEEILKKKKRERERERLPPLVLALPLIKYLFYLE
jgi:hypothetical protein